MTARQKIQAARTALILDQPFFGALALRLAVLEQEGCGTAWTDGRTLGYDPAFVNRLTADEVLGLIAHEVMHCAGGHPWRRDGREMRQWNVACDHAINHVLVEAGFRLPQGALRDPQYLGKSAEWIYARLPAQTPQDGSGDGQGDRVGVSSPDGQPSSPGVPGTGACDVRDASPDAAEDGVTEADWQQAVQQAALAAKSRGLLPASLARLAEQMAQPKVDWRSVLHRFVQQAARNDYSWRTPNTRHLARGFYLPSLRSEEVGPIAVAIDTSGSIDGVVLSQFAAELRSVVDDVKPTRVSVIYCDAKVHRVDTFERDDVVELKPVGGGGTDFRPALLAAEALDEPPVCIIYLTDLMGTFPTAAPEMPVLWASTSRTQAPFGETMVIE